MLISGWLANLAEPRRVALNVAGAAYHSPSAFGIDPVDAVRHSGKHQTAILLGVDRFAATVGPDKGNIGQD